MTSQIALIEEIERKNKMSRLNKIHPTYMIKGVYKNVETDLDKNY